MRPLIIIAKKEIKIALRERLVVSLGLIITILLSVALYTGYLAYSQQKATIEQKQQQKREEWLGQGDKHPHIAAHYGTFVFKIKTALSLFDFGLDAYTGTSIYLEAHHQHGFMFRPAQDYTSMIRFGQLSSALVLQLLLPLLVIFLAFASFTRERESGTLKLLISQGISFQTLIWGKMLAYGTILLVILLPLLVGLTMLSVGKIENKVIPDMATRAVLLGIMYLLYLFIFIALSVWISLKASNGRNALLMLLTCWIFLTIVMPKTVANLSESFYKLPSMREFKEQVAQGKTNGLDGKTTRAVRVAKLEKEYLNKYKVDSVHQLPLNFEGVSMQAGEDHGNKVYDHHLNNIRQTFFDQNRLSSAASLFNPFLAIRQLSMALSATDIHSSIHFENQVEKYRRALIRKMNNDMAQNSKYGEFYEYKANVELWNEVEDFSYRAPEALDILNFYWLELISLLLWTILFVVLLSVKQKKIKLSHG